MSIDYYNKNAQLYIASADKADMNALYAVFEKHLHNYSATQSAEGMPSQLSIPKNAYSAQEDRPLILDAGCGSGRDARYFLHKGYRVYAFDASRAMVAHCKSFLQDAVVLARFEDFTSDMRFDGIWACASLLHVYEENLVHAVQNLIAHLVPNGILFMSFKLREHNFSKHGRSFTCMNREKYAVLEAKLTGAQTIDIIESYDVREGRTNEPWISFVLKKIVKNSNETLF